MNANTLRALLRTTAPELAEALDAYDTLADRSDLALEAYRMAEAALADAEHAVIQAPHVPGARRAYVLANEAEARAYAAWFGARDARRRASAKIRTLAGDRLVDQAAQGVVG